MLFMIRFSFPRSLSICLHLFISQTLSLSLPTSSSRFLQAFSSFYTLGMRLIPLYSCISCFKTQVLGFFENFGGFFKIDECLINFGLGFHLNVFKTSYIAFHLHFNAIFMHLDVCNMLVCWQDWCMSHVHAFPMHTYYLFSYI